MKQVEHLIIGFGKAGKTLALDLANAGKSVALLEQSSTMYGGTCINVGCIPTKKLSFLSTKGVAFEQAIQAKHNLTATLNQANYDKIADKVQVITGHAEFVDAHTVKVDKGESSELIKANYIYINTGATNTFPPIKGLEGNPRVFDSTGIMQLSELPKRLVIIGAGYIGLEFAFTFANFGSEVTLLETNDVCIPREDHEIAQTLQEIMAQKGLSLKLAQRISHIEDKDEVAQIHTEEGIIEAEAILVATGRKANTDTLALDKAGVNLTPYGTVAVDEQLKTSQSHIWAMGDVAGSPQFTYISLDDYRVVKSQIFGNGDYTTEHRTFAYSVFTHPPLSNVGLTEAAAIAQGYSVKTATLPAGMIPKAKILEQTNGLLKAVVDANTDKILGVQLLCAESHEMINFLALAIKQGLTYPVVRDHIFTHPTMSEALNELFAKFDVL